MRTVGIRRVVQSTLTSLILVVGMVGLTVIGLFMIEGVERSAAVGL
ncbi:Hypothetical porin precursor [Mycobacteroides abscessus]|nr:hypothetical protein [Mycobacteroides abscessus]CPS06448.1 Hypothetical porin precursor [Mycobacteroides abscessus]CPU96615.1 Hypothetical porin precursor [Mycobacteroides abscessus]